MVNIIDLLKADHNKVKNLFAKLDSKDANNINIEERKSLFNELKKSIIIHSRAEEEDFYNNIIAKDQSLIDKMKHAAAEHKEVDILLVDETLTDFNSSKWLENFKLIRKNLEHHIKEEEEEIFPIAKKMFDSSELKELGIKFQETSQKHKLEFLTDFKEKVSEALITEGKSIKALKEKVLESA